MKSIINKIFFTVVASAMLLLTSCESEDNINITTPDPTFELDIPGISNVFLNYSLPDNPAFTITWNDGITSATSYNIEMATEDTFATPVVLGTTSEKSFSMTVTELNQAINNVGITEFNNIPVFMRVKAGEQISNSVLFLVTTYPVNAPTLDSGLADGDSFTLSLDMNDQNAFALVINDPILDANLGVTVEYFLEAAAVGTDFATVEELGTSTDSANINITHAKLNVVAQALGIAPDTTGDIEIRLRSVITNGTDDTLERIGTPITVTVSTYLTVLDLSTTWGIVGSAANNWGATPDLPFFKTDVDGVLAAYVTLIDGEIKFRENNDWAVNYGDTGADGSIELNGDNITVTAGIYIVTVDLNDNSYSLEQITNVWGLVGSAFNNWGATPDAQFTRDWSRPFDDVWILRDVELLDGEFKFRANNAWDINYGDTGGDGTLEENGDNLTATAGIYTITLDFSDAANPTYTIQP